MNFKSLLAKRYIGAQKRQSLFTVLSIALTVSLLTGFFVLFSAITHTMRTVSYEKFPGHLKIMELTEEQCRQLEDQEKVKKVIAKKAEDGSYSAFVEFSGDIGDTREWLETATTNIGAESSYQKWAYSWNTRLMTLDLIGDGSRLTMLRIFCMVFVFVLMIALGLRLVIDTAFEVSSKERERQFGVLQSVGATPRQVAGIITAESLLLSAAGIPLGLLLGSGIAYGLYKAVMKSGAEELVGRSSGASFTVDPLMLLIAAAVGIVWVMFSAYGVGMRIVRKSPMEAIVTRENNVKKVKRRSLSGLLFGITGKMASRNARRQKKRFIITVLSLTVSMTLFAVFTTVTDSISSVAKTLTGSFSASHDFALLLTEKWQESDKLPDEEFEDLSESGYFKNFHKVYYEIVGLQNEEKPGYTVLIFMDRGMYEELFPDAEVSYDQLSGSGGFVLTNYGLIKNDLLENAAVGDKFSFKTKSSDDEKKPADVEVNIIGDLGKVDPSLGYIVSGSAIGALDAHMEFISKDKEHPIPMAVYCDLAEEDSYKQAISWLKSREHDIMLDMDSYGVNHKVRMVISSVRSGVLLLNILIAVVALVNMMNIVSTGIANRRSEFASLQCIGMTRGQLIAMNCIEALQFAVTAAFISAVVCLLVLLGTDKIMTVLASDVMSATAAEAGELRKILPKLDYVTPFLRIAAASATAFAVACATSLAMLKQQDTGSLTEQIRGTD